MSNIYRRNQHWKMFNMIHRRPRLGESKAEGRARERRAETAERRRKRWFNAKKGRKRRKSSAETCDLLKQLSAG